MSVVTPNCSQSQSHTGSFNVNQPFCTVENLDKIHVSELQEPDKIAVDKSIDSCFPVTFDCFDSDQNEFVSSLESQSLSRNSGLQDSSVESPFIPSTHEDPVSNGIADNETEKLVGDLSPMVTMNSSCSMLHAHKLNSASQLNSETQVVLSRKSSTPNLPLTTNFPNLAVQYIVSKSPTNSTRSACVALPECYSGDNVPHITLSPSSNGTRSFPKGMSSISLDFDISHLGQDYVKGSSTSTISTSLSWSTANSNSLGGSVQSKSWISGSSVEKRKAPKSGVKRLTNFYNSFSPSYRTKLEQFQRIFRGTPVDTDRLLVDYSCALSKNSNGLLHQGRMYITETWVCFYSKILYEQKIFLSVKEIMAITKEKTARVIPNAIQILYSKNRERFFFTSFASRERTFAILRKVWENCRNHQAMSVEEVMQQIREIYGDNSLAMLEDEDTDRDPDLALNSYATRLRSVSESSMSSQLTGTGNSKTGSIEEGWAVDPEPADIVPFSGASHFGTTDDESKVESSGNNEVSMHGECFSDPVQTVDPVDDVPGRRCQTPDLNLLAKPMACENEAVLGKPKQSQQLQPIGKDKERKRRSRKKRSSRDRHDRDVMDMQIKSPSNINPALVSSFINVGRLSASEMNIPASCSPGHDHEGRLYVDTEIPLNVDALFACIFTDSEFFDRLSILRGTFDMAQSSWPSINWDLSELEGGTSELTSTIDRTICYTLTLKQALGPRTCTAVEQQTLLINESRPGRCYVIDAKVTNQAVPLCNCFCVVSRYCLLRINRITSRLRVSSQVIYQKPVFFGAKSIIESTCRSGLTDFFTTLTAQLNEHATNLPAEDRYTGGWLASRKGSCPNPIETNSTIPKPGQKTKPDAKSFDPASKDRSNNQNSKQDHSNSSMVANHRQLSSSIPGDQANSSPYKTYNTPGYLHQTKNGLFASGDVNYVFLRPDRAWLLLVGISLLLCVCLSMVYNRLVTLEKLAEQVSGAGFRDSKLGQEFGHNHRDTYMLQQWSSNTGESRASYPYPNEYLNSFSNSKVKVMKDLIRTLSSTLTQMQQVVQQIQKSIDLLEFPPEATGMDMNDMNRIKESSLPSQGGGTECC